MFARRACLWLVAVFLVLFVSGGSFGAEFVVAPAPQNLSARALEKRQKPPAKKRPLKSASRAAARLAADEKQLTTLARALREKESKRAYSRLATFARRHAMDALGARAALALGYFDYMKGRYAEARLWLDRAKNATELADYILFYSAQTDRNLGHDSQALDQLETLRRNFPSSALGDLALQALAETALAMNQPQQALAALSADAQVNSNPTLLFLRAQAHEQAGDTLAAATDYLVVYYTFPLSDQAEEAGAKASLLKIALGGKLPPVSLEQKILRADALYDAHRWSDAELAYEDLLSVTAGSEHEQALLREADCRVQMGAAPSILAALPLQSPEVDAERLYRLAQAYRTLNQENEMVAAIEEASSRVPTSEWTGKALFAGGNYFWVNLNRDEAVTYYKEVVDRFPASAAALPAQWREAWTAYLERKSEAASLLEAHIAAFPSSPYVPDALYWLGRIGERADDAALARTFYTELVARFPHNYFEGLAEARLNRLGPGPTEMIPVLAKIPALLPPPEVSSDLPAEAAGSIGRAEALHSIAFDSAAEVELHNAYAAAASPRLLLDAAQEAIDAERYGSAIVSIRQIYPELESRRLDEVPQQIWRLAFPLPYAAEIRRAARRARLDPMLVAGLIRQESAFAPDARSAADAIGLMQLLPDTARKLSRQLRLRYSRERLFDPAYNLRLGTVYFTGLLKDYGSAEAALAAYNAGEDRVAAWQAGQKYEEAAEFVESIPFTETRQYVEIVTRNATIYRRLYGNER